MRAIVINCSAPHYNLGAAKLTNWLRREGHQIVANPDNADLVALSVVFSWHAPEALKYARRYSDKDIWCGGPGMFALAKWWKRETGLDCIRGLDQRFERERGDYLMTFASRGCPVNCWFCIVPKIEGTAFTMDYDFIPAPVLCDNNLSELPVEFQEHIIRRYQETGVILKDANSGFEPRAFDDGTYRRWKPILKGAWRFALDENKELPQVERMMRILKDEPASKKRVYVLIGNEPMADCYERAQKVIEWGGEPYCQAVLPLNAMDRQEFIVRHDWTAQHLSDFMRYYNRWLWRKIPITDYIPRNDGIRSLNIFPMSVMADAQGESKVH